MKRNILNLTRPCVYHVQFSQEDLRLNGPERPPMRSEIVLWDCDTVCIWLSQNNLDFIVPFFRRYHVRSMCSSFIVLF